MIKETSIFEEALRRLDSFILYRSVADDPVIAGFAELAQEIVRGSHTNSVTAKYSVFISALLDKAEELCLSGDIFSKYVYFLFLNNENLFSLSCEKTSHIESTSLYSFALKDITSMLFLSHPDLRKALKQIEPDADICEYRPVAGVENTYINRLETAGNDLAAASGTLIWYYSHVGAGELGSHHMFKYDESKGLVGIKHADSVTFYDIIGYEAQKTELINNTEAFLSGAPAHNVLLTGSRGTGKSSCVKALANKYGSMGLRLVEISREQAYKLPDIVHMLAHRNKHFIIYIDDLSFDDSEIQYKYLKSLLEGGVETRPQNIIIYVTSNRRHIIQERWSDRKDVQDDSEVHSFDSLNEKLSLSDRFGLTITFPKPSPAEYLDIVTELLKKEHIDMPDMLIREQALKWEINQKGMSGRSARQFVNNAVWEMKKS